MGGGTAGVGGTGGTGVGGRGVGGEGAGGGGAFKQSIPTCDDKGLVSFVEGLNLPHPVDYLGVYLNQSAGVATLYESSGTACSGALDKAACQATLLSGAPMLGFPPVYLPNTPPHLPWYDYMFLAYTRGDSVGFVSDAEQLNALLGEIDTANEAGLVFLSMGAASECAAISETSNAYSFTMHSLPIGCSTSSPGYQFLVTHSGQTSRTALGMAMPCVGRRPDGLFESGANSGNPLGDYYANVAHLEGAAVLAFEMMEYELARFGAPHDLRASAKKARADEVRHATRMAELARRCGAVVRCARVATTAERSMLAAALENAVEGCVREAWGALSAHYQAAMACEPEVQQLWREVAADESEHAELSFALHEWYSQQLVGDERALVEAAIERARLELRVELAFAPPPHPAVARGAGVPDPASATALFSELERRLLAA